MNDSFDTSFLVNFAFWTAAVVAILCGVAVIVLQNLFRSAVALAGVFLALAGIYFLLSAEFIGAVQILVYVGAVTIILAFAIMFIKDFASASSLHKMRFQAWGLWVVALFAAITAFVVIQSPWSRVEELDNQAAISILAKSYTESAQPDGSVIVSPAETVTDGAMPGVLTDSTGPLGILLINEFILAFEIAAFVIVAALLASIAIMRMSLAKEDLVEEGGG